MTETAALHQYTTTADPEAFRQLVHAYQGLVYATCRRKLGRSEDVEDAVQKTFIKLAQHAGSVKTDLAAWLHRCATNVSIDMLRRDTTRKRYEGAVAFRVDAAGDEVDWGSVSGQVDEAVDELEELERALIIGVFFEDRSRREVAQRLGISHSTANRRMDRAVQALRAALNKRGVTAPVGVLAGGLAGIAAQAQVPAALTVELTKVGLVGAGQMGVSVAAAGATSGSLLAGLTTGKLVAAGVAAVVGAGAIIGVATMTPGPGAEPESAGSGWHVGGSGAAAAMARADEPEPDLADPLFHKPLMLASLPGYARYWLDIEDGRLLHRQQDGDAISVFEVQMIDPKANPPQLDLRLIRMEGNAMQGQINNVGRVIRGIYRFQNGGKTLLVATGQLDEDRPERFPKTLLKPIDAAVYFYGRLPDEFAASNSGGGLVDPRLAGPWIEIENCFIKPHGEELRLQELLAPSGEPMGALDIKEWVVDKKVRRLGALVRVYLPGGDHVKPLRMIYEPTEDASVIRMASFEDESPYQAQYPRGFSDRRRGVQQGLLLEYQP